MTTFLAFTTGLLLGTTVLLGAFSACCLIYYVALDEQKKEAKEEGE
jgi:hypothetical protein